MRPMGGLRVLALVTLSWLVLPVTIAGANDRVYFFHNDHLGTPQTMTDLAGRTVWTAEYEPFGKAVIDQDPDGDGWQVVNNLRFPGQYYDAETGLHYNYHRDYDPETGRYLQPDPIGIDKGRNHLYVYASNNPVLHLDPKGLADYYGIANLKTAGYFVGGGAVLWGQVRTVCRNGKYQEGLLLATFAGGSFSPLLPVTTTVFDLEVADSSPPPGDLSNLCGPATIASWSGAFIIGRSHTHLRLGQAEGDSSGWQLGFDASGIMMAGYSSVSNVQEKCCGGF